MNDRENASSSPPRGVSWVLLKDLYRVYRSAGCVLETTCIGKRAHAVCTGIASQSILQTNDLIQHLWSNNAINHAFPVLLPLLSPDTSIILSHGNCRNWSLVGALLCINRCDRCRCRQESVIIFFIGRNKLVLRVVRSPWLAGLIICSTKMR